MSTSSIQFNYGNANRTMRVRFNPYGATPVRLVELPLKSPRSRIRPSLIGPIVTRQTVTVPKRIV